MVLTWRKKIGDQGEKIAEEFLLKQGMKLLARQFKVSVGEVDLIMVDQEEIVFVEVKSRRNQSYGWPEESVTLTKIKKIWRTAQFYLQENKIFDQNWRIDVIAIQLVDGQKPAIHHIQAIDIPEKNC